jgi:hypothetical protein
MKYFVISDIHSHATEMKVALKKAGFNKRDKEHTLIVCGDVFDRGYETVEVYKYLSSIPKKRCILIKGNHEELFLELLTKIFPDQYDFSNGTVRAFCDIAQMPESKLNRNELVFENIVLNKGLDYEQITDELHRNWKVVKKLVEKSDVYKWLQSTQWRDYYEVDKYIFVHSFIPCHNPMMQPIYGMHRIGYKEFLSYNPNWRDYTSNSLEWSDARWGCPYLQYEAGLFDEEKAKGKVLVCGHWSTSDFHEYFNNEVDNYNTYISDNLICLDATTVISKQVNVYTFEI